MPIQPYTPVPIPQFNPQPAPTMADQFTRMLEPIIKMQQMKLQKQQMEQNMLMNEQAMQMNQMRMDQSQTEFDWKKDDKAREKALGDEMRQLFESGAANPQSVREVIGKYANSPQEFSSLVKEMKQEAYDMAEMAMKLRDPNMANKAAGLLQQVTGADVTGEALLKPGSKTTIKTDDQIVIVDADTGKVLHQTDITSQRQKDKDKLEAEYKRATISNMAADNDRQNRRLKMETEDREERRELARDTYELRSDVAFSKMEKTEYENQVLKATAEEKAAKVDEMFASAKLKLAQVDLIEQQVKNFGKAKELNELEQERKLLMQKQRELLGTAKPLNDLEKAKLDKLLEGTNLTALDVARTKWYEKKVFEIDNSIHDKARKVDIEVSAAQSRIRLNESLIENAKKRTDIQAMLGEARVRKINAEIYKLMQSRSEGKATTADEVRLQKLRQDLSIAKDQEARAKSKWEWQQDNKKVDHLRDEVKRVRNMRAEFLKFNSDEFKTMFSTPEGAQEIRSIAADHNRTADYVNQQIDEALDAGVLKQSEADSMRIRLIGASEVNGLRNKAKELRGGSGEETPEQAAIRKWKERKASRATTNPPVGTSNYPALPPVGMWEKPLPDEQKIYDLFRKK